MTIPDPTPGTPIRITRHSIHTRYRGRAGWIAAINTQPLPHGRTYTEYGVTFAIPTEWHHPSVDAWFQPHELEPA